MSPRDSIAVEVHRPRFKLNLDEWVAIVALVALVAGLFFGATHPQSQVTSCYQPSESRK